MSEQDELSRWAKWQAEEAYREWMGDNGEYIVTKVEGNTVTVTRVSPPDDAPQPDDEVDGGEG